MSVLRFSTRDASRVEETWKQFVPSAALQRVDPERFRFDWFSAEAPGFSLVRYDLRAEIHSVVEPEDQLLACQVTGTSAEVRTKRSPLDAGSPWLTDGAHVEARWESARVSALVFERRSAEELARRMCGDDTLRLRVQNPNDVDLPIRGLTFDVELNGQPFAKGLSDQAVVVPRFGEAVLEVKATSNLGSVLRQLRELRESGRERVDYRMFGRITLDGLGSLPFERKGEIDTPRVDLPCPPP